MARLYTREIDGKTHYYSVARVSGYRMTRCIASRKMKIAGSRTLSEMGGNGRPDRYRWCKVDYRYILEEAKAANKISPVASHPSTPSGRPGCHMTLLMKPEPRHHHSELHQHVRPDERVEAAIESGRFHHDGNPIMTWVSATWSAKPFRVTMMW